MAIEDKVARRACNDADFEPTPRTWERTGEAHEILRAEIRDYGHRLVALQGELAPEEGRGVQLELAELGLTRLFVTNALVKPSACWSCTKCAHDECAVTKLWARTKTRIKEIESQHESSSRTRSAQAGTVHPTGKHNLTR